MKLIIIILIVLSPMTLAQYLDIFDKCSDTSKIHANIFNGVTTSPLSFPFVATIFMAIDGQIKFCGGSLISPQFVLTAGHCIAELTIPSLTVILGSEQISEDEPHRLDINVPKSNLIVHEKYFYNRSHISNDIGLIRLPRIIYPTDYIRPIKLVRRPDTNLVDELTAIAGRGITGGVWGWAPKDSLKCATLEIIDDSYCKNIYKKAFHSELMCVFSPEQGFCVGDSGSPLVVRDKFDTLRQVGLASFSLLPFCFDRKPQGVIKINNHLEWIENKTGIKIDN